MRKNCDTSVYWIYTAHIVSEGRVGLEASFNEFVTMVTTQYLSIVLMANSQRTLLVDHESPTGLLQGR
jgi:hypothetical protein